VETDSPAFLPVLPFAGQTAPGGYRKNSSAGHFLIINAYCCLHGSKIEVIVLFPALPSRWPLSNLHRWPGRVHVRSFRSRLIDLVQRQTVVCDLILKDGPLCSLLLFSGASWSPSYTWSLSNIRLQKNPFFLLLVPHLYSRCRPPPSLCKTLSLYGSQWEPCHNDELPNDSRFVVHRIGTFGSHPALFLSVFFDSDRPAPLDVVDHQASILLRNR